jgi:hypothetical protein
MKDTSPDFTKPVSEMTDAERREAIARLEEQRREVIIELEEIMREAASGMKKRRLCRRRYKLGSSPNDY